MDRNTFMQYVKTFVLLTLILAGTQTNAANIPKEQEKLIELLRSDAPPAEKALVCKRLALIGNGEAVPALAALLSSPELSSWARIALEVIPDTAADDALRTAAGQLQGRLLVGVINSLGVRRDAKSVDCLVARLKDSDCGVAQAAAVALGHIGGGPAVTALRQSLAIEPKEVRWAVAEGCTLCADRYLAQGCPAEAMKLYDEIRAADLPQMQILEATRGAILARGAKGLPLLAKELQSADKKHFAFGLSIIRDLPGREATEAVVAALGRAPLQRQSLLIRALADRGEATVIPQIVQAAKSSPEQVRIEALRALKKIDETVSAPVLFEAALEDKAAISQTAMAVIDELQGPTIGGLIADRLPRASGAQRIVLMELAGRRHVAAATAALWKAAEDADAKVRRVALSALGRTIQFADYSRLIAKLRTAPDGDETAAIVEALQEASQRMPDRDDCAEKLVAALADAPVNLKCKLLEVLGVLGGRNSLAAVADAAKQGDETVRDTAFRLLGQWMSVDAAPVLVDLAKSVKDQKCQVRAVRGYIRLARQFVMPQADREALCRTALEIARRPDDKRLVLEILLRYPSREMMALALEAAKSPELKDEAGIVALAIGHSEGGDFVGLRKALAQAGHQAVKLEILEAVYGADTRTKDVTAILRRYAGKYRVIFLPSPFYNETFGNPCPLVPKHLKIRYRIDGKEGEVTLPENSTMLLPMPR